jgi:hypothetical protein
MNSRLKRDLKALIQILPASAETIKSTLGWNNRVFRYRIKTLLNKHTIGITSDFKFFFKEGRKNLCLFPKAKPPKVDRHCCSCSDVLLDHEEDQCSQCYVELPSNRPCKQCGQLLPKSRYFYCLACKHVLPIVNEDFIYHG